MRRPLSGLGAVPPATWLRFRSVGDIVSVAAVIGVLVLIIVWAQIAASRRNLVLNSSSALGGLAQLNSAFAPVFSSYPRVHFDYNTQVNSKAKFDRYDLQAFMRTCLLESESQVASCIEARLQAEVKYADYCKRYDELGRQSLGRSRSDRLDDAKYRSIEQKLYAKRRLRQPQSATLIRATVFYTSPQGRNSYSRRWDLTFEQLRDEFAAARAVRSQQSTDGLSAAAREKQDHGRRAIESVRPRQLPLSALWHLDGPRGRLARRSHHSDQQGRHLRPGQPPDPLPGLQPWEEQPIAPGLAGTTVVNPRGPAQPPCKRQAPRGHM